MRTKKSLSLLLAFFFTLINNTHAQASFGDNSQSTCGTDGVMQELLLSTPSIENINRQIELKLLQYKKSGLRPLNPLTVITLPVVVHIIHNNGPENISNARVLAGIQHLNEAFANTGYYDPSSGVSTNIQFCLAQRDPNGQGTTGITRDIAANTNMAGPYFNSDDINIKNINRWDPKCYINIWLVNNIPGPVAGYAFLPAAHGTNVDGILIEAAYFGSGYADDVVIIHEMGHYLGLYHTFEQGCTNNDCTTDGDKVCDTPPDNSTAVTSCGLTVNSCSTDILSGFTTDQNDLTQDYLDYGNWDCMSVFTKGQADRMIWHILNVRKSLLNCSSCITHCTAPIKANFTIGAHLAPTGTNISFINTSVNGASYSWYVNDILASNAYNYNQIFTQPGKYFVRLIVQSSNPGICKSEEKIDSLEITCPVKASFTPGYNGVAIIGQDITFTNTSANATSYQWYYDNNLSGTGTGYTASFNALGNHYIKLIAANQYCSDSMSLYYFINAPAGSNVSFQKRYLVADEYSNQLKNNYSFITPDQSIIQLNRVEYSNSIVTKQTSTGIVVWAKSYVNDNPWAKDIVLKKSIFTNDGNLMHLGDAHLDGLTGAELIKTDIDGKVIWNKFFYEPAQVTATDIIELPDGNFIISGNYYYGYLVFYKVSADGQVIWRKTLAYGDFDFLEASLLFFNNEVYFSGSINDRMAYSWDGFIMKINPANANIIFGKKYTHKGDQNWFKKIRTIGNRLAIEGDLVSLTQLSKKTILLTDLDGNPIDYKLIHYPDIEVLGSNADLFIGSGNKILFSMGDNQGLDAHTLVFDSSLSFVMGKTYSQAGKIAPTTISQFSNGDYLFSQNVVSNNSLLLRTLPDLSRPPCNSSVFMPDIQKDTLIITDITNRLEYGSNFPMKDTMLTISVQDRLLSSVEDCSNSISPVCDTSICNVYRLSGDKKICDLSDTVKVSLTKSFNCTLTPSWTVSGTAGYLIISQTDSFISLKITSNGDVFIKAKSMNNCKIFEDSIAINIHTSPGGIDLGKDLLLCSASTVVLHAGGGFKSCLWQDGSADSTFTAYMPGSYFVITTDFCGNVYSDSINIAIAAAQLFDLGPDKEICANDSLTIFAPAGFSDYKWSPNYAISAAYGQTVKLWSPVDTVYTVTAIKELGCSVLDSIRIKVNPVSKFSLGNDTSFCEGGSISLIAGGNFSAYQWNTGSNSQTITASTVGLYTVTATDINGCTSKDTLSILNIYANPVTNLGVDKNICQNDSIILNAGNVFQSYLWQDNSNKQTYRVHTNGIYWVKIKDIHNCSFTDTINIVSVVPKPIINLGPDTSLCNGQSLILSPGSMYLSYTWQDNSHSQNFLAEKQGLYAVSVVDDNYCSANDTMRIINVYPAPIVNIGYDTVICEGQSVKLDAGNGFEKYLWQDNSTSRFFTANASGLYQVKVSNSSGCIGADSLNITAVVPPVNFVSSTYSICENRREFIKPLGKFNSYLWFDGSTLDSVSILSPGQYWLLVKDIYGCESKESFEVVTKKCITALYFPNSFSPNNDHLNETFKPKVFGNIEQYHLEIYSRYGEKVFESTDLTKGWNGVFNNSPQNTGAYVWICTFKLKNELKQVQKGSLVLVR